MIKNQIQIDFQKCNGCGLCLNACHEHIIELRNGKAEIIRPDFCDGLGDCLSVCPNQAIKIKKTILQPLLAKRFETEESFWPVQLGLVSVTSDTFDHAHLLFAASCTAYVNSIVFQEYQKKHRILIHCPKLESMEYSEKLAQIFTYHIVESITLIRMEVPCCQKLEATIQKALRIANKKIPFTCYVLSTKGELISC